MRHVAPLFPVRSVDSTYFPAPRGCTYPASILIQDFAVSVSQCLCGKSRVLINLQPLCRLFASFPHSLPLFSRACSLFLQNTRGAGSLQPFSAARHFATRHFPDGYNACSACSTLFVRAVGSIAGFTHPMDKRIASADAAIAKLTDGAT